MGASGYHRRDAGDHVAMNRTEKEQLDSFRLDSFANHVDAKRQHTVDNALLQKDREIQRLKNRYSDLLTDYNEIKSAFEFVSQVPLGQLSPINIIHTKTKAREESVSWALASDWHVFETVRPEEVNGVNEYNPDIATARIENFFEGVVRWSDIHRRGTIIKRLLLSLLGDLITGWLHDDQRENNAGTPPEECLFLLDHLVGGIDYLLEKGKFDVIEIDCVPGNHGRITDRKRHSGRIKLTYEWLLFKILERWYKDEERIKFNIATGIHLYRDVFGMVIREHHGDDIRYQGGVGGLTIPMLKAIKEWDSYIKSDFDVFGHWHTEIIHHRFISSPCIMGCSPYSLSIKAPFQKPQQLLVTINKKRGITSFNRIYV
jgi:hypothetical protein